MADISQIKLPNGDIFDLVDESKSTATNWVNGSQTGSVRTINSKAEDSSYTIGLQAVAEGGGTTASGENSHSEGGGTIASGSQSHAEGGGTTASGGCAHAEGQSTTASNANAHAEGYGTTASNANAHAEGYGTTASGNCSHAEGGSTIANHLAQHVFGQYNIADDSTAAATLRGNYVEIVGNGSYSSRSNARTLDWEGNEWLAGSLTLGSTTLTEADIIALHTPAEGGSY